MITLITGPLCSGKSTYIRALVDVNKAAGVPTLVLELDRIGHEVLRELRGNDVDRSALAEKVFADPLRLRQLEAELHPRIMLIAHERAATFLASNPDGVVLIEAALPLDEGEYIWLMGVNRIVLKAPTVVRRARALERGMSREQFELRDRIQQGYRYE